MPDKTYTTATSTFRIDCPHHNGWYYSVPFTVLGIEIGRVKFFWCEDCLGAIYGKEYNKMIKKRIKL